MQVSPPKSSQVKQSVVGRMLYQERSRRGHDMVQAAEAIGVTKQAYSNWEKQTTGVRESNLEGIARYLGMSLGQIRPIWAREQRARMLASIARRLS